MNQTVLKALKKCHPFNGKTWCGYLQPVEIVALAEAGAVLTESERKDVEWTRKDIAKGEGGGRWFYFQLGSLKPHGQSKKTSGQVRHQRHCRKEGP